MTDLLVKLYELENDWSFLRGQAELGVEIRKPIGPEKHSIVAWVGQQFNQFWASETDRAISNTPVTCFIAVERNQLVGFACYDATALGFFGPTGVLEARRGRGTGTALLMACLLDMRLKGYGYAIIGSVGPAEFYRKVAGAIEIPDSTPGIWKNMLEPSS